MLLVLLLMTLYITIPLLFTGYLFGACLFRAGSMKFDDLRKLLGLFFGITVLWVYTEQIVSGSLRLFIENLFSLSGHYLVSEAILSFALLVMTIVFLILSHPWEEKCFPGVLEHIAKCNAHNEEGEHYFYVGRIEKFNFYDPEYAQSGGV